ncbi:unnamed protein product [Owenia fusiformis]|uniref:Cytochrome P450 n=1 Tax=Owenia fusiformis TaxID=6347 RepID=A0A8S4NQ70_OWEFU|nr:unnamed protein product [Owenia fusiformis]
MTTPPGSAGLPIVGDKSLEFYKDAIGFVDRNIAHNKSRIFLSRLLSKPTVFVSSNKGVKELLEDKAMNCDLGYKAFMYEIYGDNILFTDGINSVVLREILHNLFSAESVASYQESIQRLTSRALEDLHSRSPVNVYKFFKRLTTEICLSVFLDIDFQTAQELSSQICELTTTHWHGIISVPVSIKMPMMSSFTYGKALEAKAQLLKIIQDKLKDTTTSGFPQKIQNARFPHANLAHNHLLLFTSALVPKALASLLTSFVIAVKKDDFDKANCGSTFLDCLLLEVQRLYPPFVAGRRLVRKDCVVDGYKLHKGQAAMYMTRQAQRDPQAFTKPEEFLPQRWINAEKDERKKLFCFGAGPRCCIGQNFIWNILRTITQSLLRKYTWNIPEGQDLSFKWLPVSRPSHDVLANFVERS